MRTASMRQLHKPRSGANSGAPMIGSSSMAISPVRTECRSCSLSDSQSRITPSAMRMRSFPKEILRQHQRAAVHIFFGCSDALAKSRIIRDLDGLAQCQVLVVGQEDGNVATIALEERSPPGQLTLCDELPCPGRQVEHLQLVLAPLFHCRIVLSGMRGTHRS